MACNGHHVKALQHVQDKLEKALKERAHKRYALEALGDMIVRLQLEESAAKAQVRKCPTCAIEWDKRTSK